MKSKEKEKIRLLTVTGSRTDTLNHLLNHYKDIVDEMFIVVYEWEDFSTYSEVEQIVSGFDNAKIVRREVREKYNWEYVTQLYNETKSEFPNDWWVISDDDEFHVYSKPLRTIISECDENGWQIVRGGFIDRVGEDGSFPTIQPDINIFQQFPQAGFFRYPMSNACPNKICIVKGWIEITNGQHYAKLDGHTTWRWQGWNHPLIAPITEYNVQVHHFKWDSTCIERIKLVADIKQPYSFSDEYKTMYLRLKRTEFKIDISEPEFMFESIPALPTYDYYTKLPNQNYYSQWNELFRKIVSI
jgi:hypothetical protein